MAAVRRRDRNPQISLKSDEAGFKSLISLYRLNKVLKQRFWRKIAEKAISPSEMM
jgi:hypothetical protein